MADLAVRLGPLALANPVLTASGTYGHGTEMVGFSAPGSLGGWVSKTVTLAPRPGNRTPRLCESGAGLLNSIGLENRGIDFYLKEILPAWEGLGALVITNIGGESVEDFAELAARLDGEQRVDALEVNLSCPNIQGGKLPFATDPAMAERAIRGVRAATSKPVFAKLSPNVARIGDLAKAVEGAGADGITAVNTLLGMSIDWRSRKPGLATVLGGYSGPALKPVALRCAWECARAVAIPVIGCGGIANAADALEFIVAGCRAIQVGTAAFADPALPGRLAGDMARLLDEAGVRSIEDLVGTLDDGRARAGAAALAKV